MKHLRHLLLLLGGLSLLGAGDGQTVCSEENRLENLEACLQATRDALLDESLFWFGTDYFINCPPEEADSIDCFKQDQIPAGSSLSNIIPGLDYNTTDRYLDIVYSSDPGFYDGCDTTVVTTEATVFSLDPSEGVDDSSYPCWDARDLPQVNYNITIDDDDTQYTLVIFDSGYGFLHGTYLNIPGSDVSQADAVDAYSGPLNPAGRPNPYVFILFRQRFQNIVLDEGWVIRLGLPYELQFNIDEFMAAHGLEGPLGISWLNAAGDIYSAQTMKQMGISDNCAFHVDQALRDDVHQRPFIPADFELTVFMSIDFTAPPISYAVCCGEYENGETDLTIDSIAAYRELTPTVDVRSNDTEIAVSFSKKKLFPNPTDFLGEFHTMIMVDPDVKNSDVATNEFPLIHWMVSSITDGDFTSGYEVHNYRGPLPPDLVPHFYYYMLYQQPEDVIITDTEDYTTECDIGFRCLFQINQFVEDYNLEFVGASWMRSENEPWVNYTYIETGGDPDEYCAGDPDYPDCVQNFTLY